MKTSGDKLKAIGGGTVVEPSTRDLELQGSNAAADCTEGEEIKEEVINFKDLEAGTVAVCF